MKSLPPPASSPCLRKPSATGDDVPAPGDGWLPEVRIVVIYLIAASIWIVGSDLFLTRLSLPSAQIGILQSLKGLNFVITTAILLYFVLRRAYGGWRLAEERRMEVVRRARERYRNLCSRVQALREEDRTRIAREIHDELGQLLTGIKLELRMAENQLCNLEDRALNPIIDLIVDAGETVDSTITSVQRITSDLRPSALDHLGLAAALTDEAEHFVKRCGIACHLEIDESLAPLSPDLETAIFRIFQEALTNAARHAHARNVVAHFREEGGKIVLSVHDDGVGMDMAVLDDPQSLGIIGMMERAECVGGSLDFESEPQQGTTVTLTVPVPVPESPANLSS